MDVEKILKEVGTFGIWHVWIYFLIFSILIFRGMVSTAFVFMQDIPKFMCQLPSKELSTNNWTFDEIRFVRYIVVINFIGASTACYVPNSTLSTLQNFQCQKYQQVYPLRISLFFVKRSIFNVSLDYMLFR